MDWCHSIPKTILVKTLFPQKNLGHHMFFLKNGNNMGNICAPQKKSNNHAMKRGAPACGLFVKKKRAGDGLAESGR